MGLFEVILLCFAVIAIAALVVYYIVEYRATTTEIVDKIKATDTAVQTQDTNNRVLLGNVKSVVQQQNDINNTIYKTFSGYSNVMNANIFDVRSTLTTQTGVLGRIQATQNNYMLGMSNIFTLGSVIDTGLTPSPAWSSGVFSLPGVGKPDVRLMNHVTAVSGVTIRDLKNEAGGTARMNICSTDGRCIQVPDANGNTYITTMAPSKEIVLDGDVVAKANLRVDGMTDTNSLKTNYVISKNTIASNGVYTSRLILNEREVNVDPKSGVLSIDLNSSKIGI